MTGPGTLEVPGTISKVHEIRVIQPKIDRTKNKISFLTAVGKKIEGVSITWAENEVKVGNG